MDNARIHLLSVYKTKWNRHIIQNTGNASQLAKMPETFNYFMKGLIAQDDSNNHRHTEAYIRFKILQCILTHIYMHAKLNTQQPVVKGIGWLFPIATSCLLPLQWSLGTNEWPSCYEEQFVFSKFDLSAGIILPSLLHRPPQCSYRASRYPGSNESKSFTSQFQSQQWLHVT